MGIAIIVIAFTVLVYLISDGFGMDNKNIKRIIVSILIIFSGIFSFYMSNRPISYNDNFFFSKNILDNIPSPEKDNYLQYGEYRIMRSLESRFMQSWLPIINNIDKSNYRKPNLKAGGTVINIQDLKSKFKNNNFIKNIDYYRLVLPPNMQMSCIEENEISENVVKIEFRNKWVILNIKIAYLEPGNAIFGEISYEEQALVIFFSNKRKEYEKWYSYLRDELQGIRNWDNRVESILTSVGAK